MKSSVGPRFRARLEALFTRARSNTLARSHTPDSAMLRTAAQSPTLDCGAGAGPLIIAELSANHRGSLQRAEALVRAAAAAGADAIKLQTFDADSMTLPIQHDPFIIRDPGSLWHGRSLHELYREAATPRAWHQPLFELAESLGMAAFSSPFDRAAVDFLETLAPPCYKVASFELNDLPLLQHIGAMRRPVLLSTGMADLGEIEQAIAALRCYGGEDLPLLLLRCTSRYPAAAGQLDLASLPHLARTFGVPVGFSDHSLGSTAAIVATALGACLVEKHLVLAGDSQALDSAFSADPEALAHLVAGCREAMQVVGAVRFGQGAADASERQYRRSLFVAKALRAGDVLDESNLRCVRPGHGLPPRYQPLVLGRRVVCDLAAGTPLSWDHVMGSQQAVLPDSNKLSTATKEATRIPPDQDASTGDRS